MGIGEITTMGVGREIGVKPDLVRLLSSRRIISKAEKFVKGVGVSVELKNAPSFPSLIVITHPTLWDGTFLRLLPKTYIVANADTYNWTGIPRVDEGLAHIVAMRVPVIPNREEMNRRSYLAAARALDCGSNVVIAPLMGTTRSTAIPSAGDLCIGGTVSILRRSGNRNLVPALIDVEGEIYEDGTVPPGTNVRVIFRDTPLDLCDIDLESPYCPQTQELTERIVSSWHELAGTRG